MKKNINNERLIKKIILIIFIVNIVSLLVFILSSYKKYGFNSDSAVRLILANEIYEKGNYFPKDWFFVNGDVWLFTAHTIVIPLLRYFHVGYNLYAFSSVVMSMAILISVYTLLIRLEVKENTRLLTLIVFTSGISLAITENLYGQISYGILLLYYCLLFCNVIAILNKDNKRKLLSKILFFSLLVIIFWSNPSRGLVFFGMPLVLTLAIHFLLSLKREEIRVESKPIINMAFIILLSMAAGFLLNRVTLNNIQMNSGVTQLHWITLSEMIKRIPKIITGILFILGGEPYANRSLYTVSGMYDGFRLIIALCLMGLIPFSIGKVFKTEQNKNIKIFTIFTIGLFAIISILMIATNIYHARYLLPAIILMIVIVYAIPYDIKNNIVFDTLRILTIVGFITNTFVINTGYWTTYYASEAHKDDSHTFNNLNKLAEYMQNTNLSYGYATFWNAGSLTVLSDNKVQVRQIYIENGIPQKFKWLSANSWYEPSVTPLKTFLLLTEQETESINWKLMKDEYKLTPEYEMSFDGYRIFVFKENISNKLLNWKY